MPRSPQPVLSIRNPEIRRMLADLLPVLAKFSKRYAIGGAVAMELHGVARETMDLDVFALDDVRGQLLRAVREIGYRIEPVFEPHHYVARPPWPVSHDEVKVDILFPAGDPEHSGILAAESRTVAKGRSVRVLNDVFLTLTRVYSDQARHLLDLSLMYNRGLIPFDDVRRTLRDSDPKALRSFESKLKFISKRMAAPARPEPGRLKRSKGR